MIVVCCTRAVHQVAPVPKNNTNGALRNSSNQCRYTSGHHLPFDEAWADTLELRCCKDRAMHARGDACTTGLNPVRRLAADWPA